MKWLTRFASQLDEKSLSSKLRQKRAKYFCQFIENLNSQSPRIIDIGGNVNF